MPHVEADRAEGPCGRRWRRCCADAAGRAGELRSKDAGNEGPRGSLPSTLPSTEIHTLHPTSAGSAQPASIASRQVAGYDAVLKALWEWEIVDEDTLTAWVKDERAGRHFGVPLGDARQLREGPGEAFLYWLEQGE